MFCFLYFKSIFIKTITSFLFGDVIHKLLNGILLYTGVLYCTRMYRVDQTNYKIKVRRCMIART